LKSGSDKGGCFRFLGSTGAISSGVAIEETDAYFFEEGCRWFAAGKNPDVIVRESLSNAIHLDNDGVSQEFDWIRI
jgi:hypothetical protein